MTTAPLPCAGIAVSRSISLCSVSDSLRRQRIPSAYHQSVEWILSSQLLLWIAPVHGTLQVRLEQVKCQGEGYTLASRPLPIGSIVEVLIDGRWIEGIASQREGMKTIEIEQGYGTKAAVVLREALGARWPAYVKPYVLTETWA